ncbi:hypothetical protein [Mucilaginibacter gynuensis]
MKRKFVAAALILSVGILTSCKKEQVIKPVLPLSKDMGSFKKDISWAD